jgi:hypothetical protein
MLTALHLLIHDILSVGARRASLSWGGFYLPHVHEKNNAGEKEKAEHDHLLLHQNSFRAVGTHELTRFFVHCLVHEVLVIQGLAEDTLVLLLFNLEDLAGVAHSVITLWTYGLVAHATSVCLGNSVGDVGDELRIANGAERGGHCIAVGLVLKYEIRFTACKKFFCFFWLVLIYSSASSHGACSSAETASSVRNARACATFSAAERSAFPASSAILAWIDSPTDMRG